MRGRHEAAGPAVVIDVEVEVGKLDGVGRAAQEGDHGDRYEPSGARPSKRGAHQLMTCVMVTWPRAGAVR